jgi:hypothetical protein
MNGSKDSKASKAGSFIAVFVKASDCVPLSDGELFFLSQASNADKTSI